MKKKTKKVMKKSTKPAARSKPAAKPAAKKGKRVSWLSPKTDKPLIDGYTRQLSSFIAAMADGVVDESEVAGQEKQLVQLMKQIEPLLDDEQHALITRLLCEITAYDIMRLLHEMHRNRPKVKFRG
ncbi:MAG: hypothetical protein HJJLKODD_00652 [Phycisphaerae bacterium]|nr:hypothetical protein [Phycisphaerae bacterium]